MWKSILGSTFFAGTLDLAAACLNAYLSSGTRPDRVLQYIASGVFGRRAFRGGEAMLAWGLFFHYLIVLGCVICYFLLYPRIRALRGRIWVNAVLIGVVAWAVTNLVVIPLSAAPALKLTVLGSVKSAGILVVCIGLPVVIWRREATSY